MTDEALRQGVDAAWEVRDRLGPDAKGELRDVVEKAVDLLDAGAARGAE